MEGALKKAQDIVHLGKLATDFLPGFLFLAAMLVGLTSTGEHALQAFPFQAVDDLEERAEELRGGVADAEGAYRAQLDRRREAPDDVARAVAVEKERLAAAKLERLQQALERVDARLAEAHDLNANIDALAQNAWSLSLVSLVLGIGLAQIAGGVFYSGLFRRRFRASEPALYDELFGDDTATIDTLLARLDPAVRAELPDLERTSYRYLEIAMNLILPTALLGLALAVSGITRGSAFSIVLGLLTLSAVPPLVRHAYDQFASYFRARVRRQRELKRLVG